MQSVSIPVTTPSRRVRSRHRTLPHDMADGPGSHCGTATASKRGREAENALEPSKHQARALASVSCPTQAHLHALSRVPCSGGDSNLGPFHCPGPGSQGCKMIRHLYEDHMHMNLP